MMGTRTLIPQIVLSVAWAGRRKWSVWIIRCPLHKEGRLAEALPSSKDRRRGKDRQLKGVVVLDHLTVALL